MGGPAHRLGTVLEDSASTGANMPSWLVEEVQIRSRLLYYIDQLERAHGDATPGVFLDGLTYADVADRMAWRWARWKVDPAWMQRLRGGNG